jgi:hypothetical protein
VTGDVRSRSAADIFRTGGAFGESIAHSGPVTTAAAQPQISGKLLYNRLNEESGQLYNQRGELLREVANTDIDAVYCVCVTASSYGAVAVDLSMLLEKDQADEYPWAVNVNDLESTICAFKRKEWGPDKFREFLEQRQKLQGKAFTDDELEIVGAFVLYGTLDPWIACPIEMISFQPGFSRIFDAIYKEQHGGPPPILEATAPPRFDDMRSVMAALAHESRNGIDIRAEGNLGPFRGHISRRRVGRNEPCPCGSGKKFKHCCCRTQR